MDNSPTSETRVDEVAQHYRAPARAASVSWWLFYVGAALSLATPFASLMSNKLLAQGVVVAFLVATLAHFVVDQAQRFYWLPRAQRERRRSLLSDAFGAVLTHDRTNLYHNNEVDPSVRRLGANTLENAFFSKSIAQDMLKRARAVSAVYAALWLVVFAVRHDSLDTLTGATQIVFSGNIIAGWLNLEVLRSRFERTFDDLHAHFRAAQQTRSANEIAEVIDAVIAYEAAKAAAGVLLDSATFNRLNTELSSRWARIRSDVGIDG